MRRSLLCAAALLLLAPSLARAATLTVTADKATYTIGETITLSVVGDAEGESDLVMTGNLEYDPTLVTVIDNVTEEHPLTGQEAFGSQWNRLAATGECFFGLPALENICKPFDYVTTTLPTNPQSLANDPILFATLTFSADAVGTANFDWADTLFFSIEGPQTGTSVLITPEPSSIALVALGLLAMGARQRAS